MDQYPEFKVSECEYQSSDSTTCSRHNSISSSTDKSVRHSLEAPADSPAPQPHHPPRTGSRRDSHDDASVNGNSTSILAEYIKYTDAPPAYSEKQYEGKSSDEVNRMRKRDYAIEISRLMGRQLVKGLKPQATSRHGSMDAK